MNFLASGPDGSACLLLFAHSAGAPMDAPFMNAIARRLAERGLAVLRFEFNYMAARRHGQGRKSPPRAERVMDEFRAAVAAAGSDRPILIGGKSMGGRVASMVADDLFEAGRIGGLFCLGYPFHPPGKPEQLRIAHLAKLKTPALICQGTRDPFGTREEVAAYALSPGVGVCWLEDGDHDFRTPRGSAGSSAGNLQAAADAVAAWAKEIVAAGR